MRRAVWICVVGSLSCSPSLRAQGPAVSSEEASPAALEALVGEYVRIRAVLSREKRDWTEQERRLQEEMALLEAEKGQLEKTLQRYAEEECRQKRERREQTERRQVLAAAIDGLSPPLDEAERRLRLWRRLIPPALSADLDSVFRDLAAEVPAGGREDRLRRLQRVMALYAQIEQMQTRIHAVRERLPVEPNIRREVDVLYVGLARAFAVSGDNQWAAVGHPGEAGWIWVADAALAPSVRRAFDMHGRQTTAQFVSLPMQLTAAGSRNESVPDAAAGKVEATAQGETPSAAEPAKGSP